MKEIRLNKEQFRVFNDYDQFQIFTDEDGWANYEDLNIEFEKLFEKYETFIINEDDYIYGEKEGVRTLIISDASEAFLIADEVLND
jgi:hypothetical protein